MKKIGKFMLYFLAIFILAACGNGASNETAEESNEETSQATE